MSGPGVTASDRALAWRAKALARRAAGRRRRASTGSARRVTAAAERGADVGVGGRRRATPTRRTLGRFKQPIKKEIEAQARALEMHRVIRTLVIVTSVALVTKNVLLFFDVKIWWLSLHSRRCSF